MAASCQDGERLDTPAYCQSQLVGASADASKVGIYLLVDIRCALSGMKERVSLFIIISP